MFERTEKTRRLLDLFRSTNGTLAYDTITAHMGEPLDALRPTIFNVRKYLERDEGIVFECIPRQGYVRLTDAEKVQSTAGIQRRIHRVSGRGLMRIAAVSDYNSLPPDQQMTATIRKTVFEAIRRETGEKK